MRKLFRGTGFWFAPAARTSGRIVHAGMLADAQACAARPNVVSHNDARVRSPVEHERGVAADMIRRHLAGACRAFFPRARLAATRHTLLAPCASGGRRIAQSRAIGATASWRGLMDCSPQVVAGAASFGLDPPLSREMLLLGSREALARRDKSLGGAVDARAGGNGREQCGGSVHWSPGE